MISQLNRNITEKGWQQGNASDPLAREANSTAKDSYAWATFLKMLVEGVFPNTRAVEWLNHDSRPLC